MSVDANPRSQLCLPQSPKALAFFHGPTSIFSVDYLLLLIKKVEHRVGIRDASVLNQERQQQDVSRMQVMSTVYSLHTHR